MQMIRIKINKTTVKVFKRDTEVTDALMIQSNNTKVNSKRYSLNIKVMIICNKDKLGMTQVLLSQ